MAFSTGTATAAPVGVTLRVEGRTQTIFDGPVTTDGHDVTTPSGGTHRCDGTNGSAEPSPGPTATAALDDAARLAGFSFDGNYGNFGIDDYFLTRIAQRHRRRVVGVLVAVDRLRLLRQGRLPEARSPG